MSWFGKVFGGILGFSLGAGTPLGILIGAVIGHQLDKKADEVQQRFSPGDQERVQAAFFTATFSVMGHMAKADGVVSNQEIRHAESVMARMGLDEASRKMAIDLFKQGKSDSYDLDGVLEQFRKESHRRKNLLQMFLEVQIGMAMADGQIGQPEQQVLKYIGQKLGFGNFVIEQLIRMVQAQQRFHQYSQQSGQQHSSQGGYSAGRQVHAPSIGQAYQLLGVESSADKDTVKKAYRRLMSQHHPDKLVAKGLPEQMIKIATEKTQEIKAAYELIKQHKDW